MRVEPRLGTLHMVDGRPTIQFERWLAHPVEKVWQAIIDPAELRHWFPAEVHAEPEIGAPIRFSFPGAEVDQDSPESSGEILEFDPPKVYAFQWADSVLRFELIPDGTGCRLRFTHTLSGTGTRGDRASSARQAAGWDGCLDLLAAVLDGDPRPSLPGQWWFPRAEAYVEKFGLAEGEVREHADGCLVRFERDLVQPVADVWATLTEGHDGDIAAGGPIPARCTNHYVPGDSISTAAGPHVIEYTWRHDGEPAGLVRIELNPQQPIGCRLVLTQTVPARLVDVLPTALAAWQTHLELVFAAAHGDVRCPWPTERTAGLRDMYAERLAR
jgi:uncharacterized protein YndB with AHSA1/START domain